MGSGTAVFEEEVGAALIEAVEAFPVEGVASVVEEVEFCVGDVSGEFFAHPARGEDVVFATDDEAGGIDAGEVGEDVVGDAGVGLAFEGVERLRGWVACGVEEPLGEALGGFVVVPEWFGEDEELDVAHHVFWAEVSLDGFEVFEDGFAVVVEAGPCAHEDGAFDFFRVPEGELLGDDAAHGAADDVGFFDAEGVHETGVVVGHHGACVWAGGFIGEADAAVVAEDAAEVFFPDGGVGFPDAAWGGDAHDADDGFAGTAFFVVHFDTVGFDRGHGSGGWGVKGEVPVVGRRGRDASDLLRIAGMGAGECWWEEGTRIWGEAWVDGLGLGRQRVG